MFFKKQANKKKHLYTYQNEDVKCVLILGKSLLYLNVLMISLLKKQHFLLLLLFNSGYNPFHWGKDKDPLLKKWSKMLWKQETGYFCKTAILLFLGCWQWKSSLKPSQTQVCRTHIICIIISFYVAFLGELIPYNNSLL